MIMHPYFQPCQKEEIIPVFCFDLRVLEIWLGFRTGPFRAKFLIESVDSKNHFKTLGQTINRN